MLARPAPPPAFVSFDAPAGGAREHRKGVNDAAEGGAGWGARNVSRTEAKDKQAGGQEQVPTQAAVREAAAPGGDTPSGSEGGDDADDDASEGGCAPQADDSMHLSGGAASTSSDDDDARGGGGGSES